MANRTAGGLLLAFQFFSAIPVRKEVPVKSPQVTAMYSFLPLVGAVIGTMLALALWLMRDVAEVGPLLAAFILALLLWGLTGGLHMDGLADTGDAYFSHRSRGRRLEIMGDPRIGAFGAMVLIFAIAGKIILLAELIPAMPLFVMAAIPIISRIGLPILSLYSTPAKPDGLAAHFGRLANRRTVALAMAAWALSLFFILGAACGWPLALALFAVTGLALWLYGNWCNRNFGGVTGDLLGAYAEGMELMLWGMLLFFI